MKVTLFHRHHGVYDHRGDADLPGSFSDYARQKEPAERDRPNDPDEYVIDEDELLAALPEGFIPLSTIDPGPVPPRRILLTVSDEAGGTGQTRLARFRNFGKYFDSYVLDLAKEPA